MSGQEVLASGVEFAEMADLFFFSASIVPRVRYAGRVDFDGVYGDVDQIDVFKLALSNNNLRPSASAMFVFNN